VDPAVDGTDPHQRQEPTPEQAAKVFKALADPLRIQLVTLTRAAPDSTACFCDLADQFDMPQSTLSHHLRVLVEAGILERERRGTWSWYRLREEPFALLHDLIRPDGLVLRPSPRCSCEAPTSTTVDLEFDPGRDGLETAS
jgi:Predicted transcriptional regulators